MLIIKPLKNQGFTLIELIAVVFIIAILASMAIPKFFAYREDALSANLTTTANAFASAVSLVHATWLADGANPNKNSVMAESGETIGLNDAGWPENIATTGGDGIITNLECESLLLNLINNVDLSKYVIANTDTLCNYQLNNHPDKSFTYNSTNGTVIVNLPQ